MENKKTTVIVQIQLEEHEFFCKKCQTIHKKSPYAIAQASMKVALVFTCPCGNKINL